MGGQSDLDGFRVFLYEYDTLVPSQADRDPLLVPNVTLAWLCNRADFREVQQGRTGYYTT